jgi:hypothetical protein
MQQASSFCRDQDAEGGSTKAGSVAMKVMVIVKATKESEAGVMPSHELLVAMGRFNEELARSGVMLAGEGLHPSAKGVRMRFPEGVVTDGPFAETKELIAGYWLWEIASMQEAIDWLRRSPFREHPEADVEIRPVFTAEDFGQALAPEVRAQEERIAAVAASRLGSAV